jgi:hypothetical protein
MDDEDLEPEELAYARLGDAPDHALAGELEALAPPLRGAAAFVAFEEADQGTLVRMIHAGLDPNTSDPEQGCLLSTAILDGMMDVVAALLERGADPRARFEDETPLAVAAAEKSVFAVERILATGLMEIDEIEEALEIAEEVGCEECAERLRAALEEG